MSLHLSSTKHHIIMFVVNKILTCLDSRYHELNRSNFRLFKRARLDFFSKLPKLEYFKAGGAIKNTDRQPITDAIFLVLFEHFNER